MANFINMESASELLHRRAIPCPLNPPPNYNYFSNPSKTLLKEAIENNDCEFLKTRIELSQEFRKPENLLMYKFDQHESNMLHLTAKYCSLDFFKVLVEDCKIDKINSPNKNLMTPLHYLVLFNNFNLMDESSIGKIESSAKYEKVKEYLSYLVSKGIDLNARDQWRFTALNYAAIKNNLVLTKLLVEHHLKALNNIGIRKNQSEANILEEISKIKITPETIRQKFNENLCNSLIIACEHGSLDVANILIRDYLDGKLLKLYDFKKNIYHLIAKNKQDSGNKIERIFTNVKEKLDDPDRKILSEKDKETGLNLLHMAISNNHFSILRIMVSNREDFDSVNNIGGPDEDWPLHFVAKSGSIECLEILKSENFGEDLVSKLNKNLENIFHVAIAHKKNAFIRHLLNQKDIRSHIQEALVNKNLSLMTTPIEYAMYLGNLEAARMLEVWTDLDRVDFKCAGLQRSLFYACVENGHIDSIYYLFALLDRKYGLNWLEREQLLREAISLADEPDENTVFHLAAQKSNFEMIKYLIEKFPFVFDDILFYKNRLELSCFHICCKKGDEKSVRFLLEKSIAHGKQTLLLSSRDSHCNSPLHLACIHNHIQIARLLVEFGANLTQRNMHDQTPFHVCCDNSSLSILKYLFEVASQQSLNVRVDWEMIQLAIRKDDSQMFAFLSSNDLSYLFKDNERKVEMHDFFDLAFKTKSMSILQALIRDPNWMAYLKVDLNDPNLKTIDYSRFRILTNHMPNLALAILDKFATSEKTSIVYDFRFIDPTPKSVGFNLDNHPMFILSKTENSRILSHRVVKKLAGLKWTGGSEGLRNSMPVIIFIFHFVLFLTYLIFITLLICSVHNFMSSLKNADNAPEPLISLNTTQVIPTNYSDYFKGSFNYSEAVNASQYNSTIRVGKLLKRSYPQDDFHQLVEQSWFNLLFTVSITLSSILLLKTALVQIFKMIDSIESVRSILKMLIKQSSEMIVYLLSLLYVVNISFVQFQFDLGLGFGPFLLIINWCLIMMFIDKLPYVGIFAIMFKKILFESIKILPILVIMLLAFGFSLNVIKEERNEWKSLFSTFLSSMEAMINISPDDKYKNTYLAGIVFFLFMCMISLVLLNLFIGVAIGEIENVYEDADVKQLSLKLEFCLRVQFLESKIVGDRFNMIPPTHEEDKTAKEIKDSKFGRRHFNYRLERENQEKQQLAFDEMKTKVDMIFRKLEIEEKIN